MEQITTGGVGANNEGARSDIATIQEDHMVARVGQRPFVPTIKRKASPLLIRHGWWKPIRSKTFVFEHPSGASRSVTSQCITGPEHVGFLSGMATIAVKNLVTRVIYGATNGLI
jgi:hypothetical protein